MVELGNKALVETAVKHGSDIENPQEAFKNLNIDLTAAENSMSRQEYVNYLEQVRVGLVQSGALPDLAITWAQDKVKTSGALTHEQLIEAASGSSTKKGQGLNTSFASMVSSSFDTFKNANFDKDTYGLEKNFITGADVEQVRRHQNFYREKEADLRAYVGLAYEHRDDYEKQLLARIDRDSLTTLQPGEGLWDVAVRVLKSDGHSTDREHVARYTEELKRFNRDKKMEPGTTIVLQHFDTQSTLYDIGMQGYFAHHDARLYASRKAYVHSGEIISLDTRRTKTQPNSWGIE